MSLFFARGASYFRPRRFYFLPAASAHILRDSRPVHQHGADSW
ncbi:hypothetical protein C4K27_3554 [Pseudomonas chlororaphis subsp. chlororaphis]|nr:hypothetical protein C4K27_3554 [Pseudomonas chlororaphis subsp. chlororaphis]